MSVKRNYCWFVIGYATCVLLHQFTPVIHFADLFKPFFKEKDAVSFLVPDEPKKPNIICLTVNGEEWVRKTEKNNFNSDFTYDNQSTSKTL